MTVISKKFERVPSTGTPIKLIMPQKFLDQVKWLCKEIPKVEWSGVLFYSIEGSITDPENMVITVEEILPMHKGTAAYTEYTFDEKVLNFMMDTPGADDWKMGHIHSHNTMNVYFSGTDWSELEDNSPNHNFYLSLIVNNFMDFCAKVAFIVKSEKAEFQGRDEQGNKYNYLVDSEEQEKMITYDCAIDVPGQEINVEDSFKKKVDGIIEDAAKRPVYTPRTFTTVHTGGIGNRNTTVNTVNRNFQTPRSQSHIPNHVNQGNQWQRQNWGKSGDSWEDKLTPDIVSAIEDAEEDMLEEFTKLILNTGNNVEDCRDLEDVLEIYKGTGMTPNALAEGVIRNYLPVYNKFFDKNPDKDTPDMFEEITNGVIGNLEVEIQTTLMRDTMDMLTGVKNALKNMLNKFTRHEYSTVK